MPVNDDMKQAVKEALRDWLDERYTEVGRWTLRGLTAAALGGLVYLSIWMQAHK